MLIGRSRKAMISLLVADNALCGFAYSISDDRNVFIVFLAIDRSKRRKTSISRTDSRSQLLYKGDYLEKEEVEKMIRHFSFGLYSSKRRRDTTTIASLKL